MNPIIRVENLGKKYSIGSKESYYSLRDTLSSPLAWVKKKKANDFWALKNVNFEVNQGEAVGIIGRNGAGKSTLLKVLSQITPPTNGKITMRGRVASLLEVGTGFHPELTGRENIFLNGAILGMSRSEVKKNFDGIVAFAEVEQFLDTPVKRYSSGMYVRLAFAVAAHLEPEILIVDEVLAVGDIQFQKKCLAKMQDVAKSGRTVLFVSHNMSNIHKLCTRCILLKNGSLVLDGNPNKVIRKYISEGITKQTHYSQRHNLEKPINLREVNLFGENNNPANEFRYDQPLKIFIKYEVNKRVSGCSIWMAIRTFEEVIVFGSADTDLDNNISQTREVGMYKTVLELPDRWLNSGSYYLVVGIVGPASTTYDRVEVTSFDIIDVGVPETNRPGLLQPFLSWKTNKKD